MANFGKIAQKSVSLEFCKWLLGSTFTEWLSFQRAREWVSAPDSSISTGTYTMTVQANFQDLPPELKFHVLGQLGLETLLTTCWRVSSEWRDIAQEIAQQRASQLAERLELPKEVPMWKTCVRVKELARVCGIEAKGKTLEDLVEELKEKADKIEGLEGRKAYFKLLFNKFFEEKENDKQFILSSRLKDKGLNADQIFLMAKNGIRFSCPPACTSFGLFFCLDGLATHLLNDPDLKVLLKTMIESLDRIRLGRSNYQQSLKKLLSLKDRAIDQQKDALDEVIVSLIKKAKQLNVNLSLLQNEVSDQLSDEALAALPLPGEDIGENTVIDLVGQHLEKHCSC